MARPDELDNPNEGSNLDKYRDNHEVRDPEPSDQRVDTKSDSKSEARGDARENNGSKAADGRVTEAGSGGLAVGIS